MRPVDQCHVKTVRSQLQRLCHHFLVKKLSQTVRIVNIIIKDCTTAKSKVSTISKTTELKIAHGHLMPRVSICVMDLLSCKLFHLRRGMDRNGLADTESVLAYGHHGWRAWLTCGKRAGLRLDVGTGHTGTRKQRGRQSENIMPPPASI